MSVLTLTPRSLFSWNFLVLDGEQKIGSIVPESVFTPQSVVTLPDDWPLPIKAFAMWLTVMHWRRDARSGSG